MPIPTQAQYEAREAQAFHVDLERARKGTRHEKRDAMQEYYLSMKREPELIAERVRWLLDGNYGYGAMKAAWKIVGLSERANKHAQLGNIIAALDWNCPREYAARAWVKLTSAEKEKLRRAIVDVMEDAIKEKENQ